MEARRLPLGTFFFFDTEKIFEVRSGESFGFAAVLSTRTALNDMTMYLLLPR